MEPLPASPEGSAPETQVPQPRLLRPGWAVLAGAVLVLQLFGFYSPAGGEPLLALPEHSDKVIHGLSFFAFTACSLLARLRMDLVLGFACVHAAVSEVIQGLFIETRSGDILDVAANGSGILLGAVAAALLMRQRG